MRSCRSKCNCDEGDNGPVTRAPRGSAGAACTRALGPETLTVALATRGADANALAARASAAKGRRRDEERMISYFRLKTTNKVDEVARAYLPFERFCTRSEQVVS